MDSKYSGQWERLNAVIGWSGMTAHAFANHLGLKRSEVLYRVKSGKNGISRRLAILVSKIYPEINDIWLLTGSGTMLKCIGYVDAVDVPYYTAGIAQYLKAPDICSSRFMVPATYKAEVAIDVEESIINEIIPTGTVALLRETKQENIIYGQPYYIVTEFFNEFCILEESSNPDEITICGKANKKNTLQLENINELDEHEQIEALKLKIKELKKSILKDKKIIKNKSEEDACLGEQNRTSVRRISINAIFDICGYVKKF